MKDLLNDKHYRIDVINWRNGALSVQMPNDERVETSIELLSAACTSDIIGKLYCRLRERALAAIAIARNAEIRKCPKHSAQKSAEYGFSGCVNNYEENRAAHGNIMRVETCRCGAERRHNLNGVHIESGEWC